MVKKTNVEKRLAEFDRAREEFVDAAGMELTTAMKAVETETKAAVEAALTKLKAAGQPLETSSVEALAEPWFREAIRCDFIDGCGQLVRALDDVVRAAVRVEQALHESGGSLADRDERLCRVGGEPCHICAVCGEDLR